MKRLLFLPLLLILCGCSHRVSHLGVITTTQSFFNQDALDNSQLTPQVTGSSTRPIILLLPIGTPNLKSAVNDTLKKGNGNIILNATVDESFYWFIIGMRQIKITADVLNTNY